MLRICIYFTSSSNGNRTHSAKQGEWGCEILFGKSLQFSYSYTNIHGF